MTLVTRQTGPEGRIVKKLLIEAGQKIEKELYLSLLSCGPGHGIYCDHGKQGWRHEH